MLHPAFAHFVPIAGQRHRPCGCAIGVCTRPAISRVRCVVGDVGLVSSVGQALFMPLFDPIDACIPFSARVAAWLNFRSAVLLFVISPLGLFFGALGRELNGGDGDGGGGGGRTDALVRVMSGYWQASALLLVAVFQHAAGQREAFACGLLVQAVIVCSINWWDDLLSEINASDGFLESTFRAWRPVATGAAVAGIAVQMAFSGCNFNTDCACEAWWEPPRRLFELLGGEPGTESLALLGTTGMLIYLAYLAYYVTVVIPRVGRSGRKRRDVFTAASVLVWLGIFTPWDEEQADSS